MGDDRGWCLCVEGVVCDWRLRKKVRQSSQAEEWRGGGWKSQT